MTKAVFQHKADSIYDDTPWERYEFPKRYLRDVEKTKGDWIVYYEPRSAEGNQGRLRYFATARVTDVGPSTSHPEMFMAHIDPSSYVEFARPVDRVLDGRVIERSLRAPDGSIARGGNVQRAVRLLADDEFAAIAAHGIDASPERWEREHGFSDEAALFERPMIERLTRRAERDANFRKQVLRAYGNRCAISDFALANGFGRPEVEAAHIRPVTHSGPDTVRNGLALSHTVHWMFDRGLITITEDFSILVSENKVPSDVSARLIRPDRRLRRPENRRDDPHPEFLKYHRENIFGRGEPMYTLPPT
ncbi:HNH endonuclease [Limibaculum sp. M0105]|uniref:HNH endonuclease n=1 Tax=Thermohalobaculum xanthum TaxID=2753746 RepID=A0A8J7SFS4_9RHOB|nr:HNH endonuclease [Thermohalobaculum xanthum]MBK0398630.1 HNH endonuclease [Thermohalobaculum xanthum]